MADTPNFIPQPATGPFPATGQAIGKVELDLEFSATNTIASGNTALLYTAPVGYLIVGAVASVEVAGTTNCNLAFGSFVSAIDLDGAVGTRVGGFGAGVTTLSVTASTAAAAAGTVKVCVYVVDAL